MPANAGCVRLLRESEEVMAIEATYHGEVRVVRSSYTSKTGPTITLALHDIDELNRVQGMDGKRYMLALVEIGDDEQPVPSAAILEKPKGGALAKLAGMWCSDPEFWRWASTRMDLPVSNANGAAAFIRLNCGVDSRAELDSNDEAADLFQKHIRGPYMKHLASIGVTA